MSGCDVTTETWEMALDGRGARFSGNVETSSGEMVCFSSDNGTYADAAELERARLIAAAPELYRALLAVEWSGEVDAEFSRCPSCEGYSDDGHKAGCALDAAIRKARGET